MILLFSCVFFSLFAPIECFLCAYKFKEMRKSIVITVLFASLAVFAAQGKPSKAGQKDREQWVAAMDKICRPVLDNLSQGKLRENMPVENYGRLETAKTTTHLEAIGRLLTGIAPWLELGPDSTKEGKLREEYISMTLAALRHSVDPSSPDCLNFCQGKQPLVDAAFLAHALLRSKTQVWDKLDAQTQERMLEAFKSTRVIKPHENNWLLFVGIVECAIKEFGGEWDYDRVEYAITKHEEWYKGDGWYGDGPNMHFDYYNSFVIHPMLTQILETVSKHDPEKAKTLKEQNRRYARYAAQLERLISPEGTFPAVGRSLAYRFGAFYALSDVAFRQTLPSKVSPAQVRSGLTAVIRRQMSMKGTFDKDGWLTIGFVGHQPSIGEGYISTGSLYLCCAAFIALGLPPENDFWSAPYQDWTQKKVWKGEDVPCDKALKTSKKK